MRVGITQRVEYITDYEEVRDCLDQRWSDLLETLEMKIIPIPNSLTNIEEWLDLMQCDAFILSGGNDLAHLSNAKNISIERDNTEMQILKYAESKSLPVLGVCRGFQVMNVFFGGQLNKLSIEVGSIHKVKMSFDAGCDMVIICNNRSGTKEVIEYLDETGVEQSSKISEIKSSKKINWNNLLINKRALAIKEKLKNMRN